MKKWTAGILSALMLFSLCACSTDAPEASAPPETSGALLQPLAAVSYPAAVAYDDYDAKREVREENPVTDDFYAALDTFSYKTASAVLSGAEGNANYISAGNDVNAIVSNTILASAFRPEQLAGSKK